MRILSASGDARPLSAAGAAPIGAGRIAADGRELRPAPRGATSRTRVPSPGALSISKRPPSSVSRSRMLNSPHPTWPAFDRRRVRRVEPDPLIRHRDAQLIVGAERQLQRDAIRLRVLDGVEQEFSDRLEEQRANVLPRGIGARIDVDLDVELVLVARPVRQPGQRGRQSRTSAAREETARGSTTARRRSLGQVDVSPPTAVRSARCRVSPVAVQLLIEVQCGDDQQLLESVVQRLGDLLTRVLLGERQVRRHPAQLRGPVFQFDGALLEGRRRALRSVMSVTNAKARPPSRCGDVIQADFDRKRRSVFPLPDQLQAAVHQTRIAARRK